MRVVVRADGSSVIGIGHLMRTLALAQALRDGGADVTLVTTSAAGRLTEFWLRERASVTVIDVAPGSTDDAAATRRAASEADWLVLDGYAFDADFRTQAHGATRRLVVDDHAIGPIEAEIVVNGNLYASDEMYAGSRARLLLGPRYAMLRREFREPPAAQVARHGVLLSLGGADPDARTAPVLRALATQGLHGAVVIGPHHAAATAAHDAARRHGWDALEAPERMDDLLRRYAIAVLGAGTTASEAAASGTPMIAVRIAENQRLVADSLERLGLALVADGSDVEGIAQAAVALLADGGLRARMTRIGPSLVDGRGAVRVAAAMRAALLRLRPASLADAELLLDWRNDPVTRAASFSSEVVTKRDHLAWLQRSLDDSARWIHIGELEGRAVGMVRLDTVGTTAVVSVLVAPDARGSGIAQALIRSAVEVAESGGLTRLEAHIRTENDRSRRAFAAVGFTRDPANTRIGSMVMTLRLDQHG